MHERIAPPLEAAGVAFWRSMSTARHRDPDRHLPRRPEFLPARHRRGARRRRRARRSLRLIVFDRVPWPRPDILHKARKAAFGGTAYDDMITRLRLKQAYGRLIRRADDNGVFVLLDSRLPSRLAGAFPDGVEIERIGLAEAVKTVREFAGRRSRTQKPGLTILDVARTPAQLTRRPATLRPPA